MGKRKQKVNENTSVLRKKEVYIPIIIGAIITIMITVIISSMFYFLTIENEPCIQGPSGNSYHDCYMNFEIMKPNRDWRFHYDFNINVPKFDILFPGQSIVEMVLVERTKNEQVVVIVYDDKSNLDLRMFVENEIDMASATKLPIQMIYKLPSENKQEDDITIDTQFFNNHEDEKVLKIFKERIIKKDGLVYVIHSQIRSTENVSERTWSELNQIFDSFKFL